LTTTRSAQLSARIHILHKNLLQGVHRSRIQSSRSALTESVSTRKLRRNSVKFLCRKCKTTTARFSQSSQELKYYVKICCKECTSLEFDKDSKRLHKEVKGQEQRNARKVGKNYFQEYLDLSLMNFPEKQ
jgi:hypothetical protein